MSHRDTWLYRLAFFCVALSASFTTCAYIDHWPWWTFIPSTVLLVIATIALLTMERNERD